MAELVGLLGRVGLTDVRVTERFDCFRGSPAEGKLPADFEVGGTNVFARKP